ncbi:MAG TPA: FAD-binding oxidoreductase [Acidimicrobiales bacterium]|nr:FAD-binding oxidoreductase [Acidimicrobiales bacterium]
MLPGGAGAPEVVRPATTAEVAATLRDRPGAVLVRGTATKLAWGGEPRAVDLVVDTTALAGVVEHVAGDLVVTVRAGTTLEALDAAVAPFGQRLAADPVVGPGAAGRGTVGGLVATAATGPLRLSVGAVRDLLIGAEVVRADGVVARAGGKVVKNVAGYDLCKLLTGSWGTLAVLTAATFRLHPRPAATRWVLVPELPTGAVVGAIGALRRSQLAPAAVEVDWAGGHGRLAVLIEGTEEGAGARADAAAALAGGRPAPAAPPWWGRPPWPAGGTGLRVTFGLSGLAPLLDAVDATGLPWAVRGSAAVGVVHAGVGPDHEPAAVAAAVVAVRAAAARAGGQVVVLDAPAPVRAEVDVWGPADGLAVMRRVKAAFDPGGRLAPGRFVGGI